MDQKEELSLEENNTPLAQFNGLSIREIYYLVNDPLSEHSPFRVLKDIPNITLDSLPFFKSCEDFLHFIQTEKKIKLTSRETLPRKVLNHIYERCLGVNPMIEKGLIKVNHQEDWCYFESILLVCRIGGLVRKTGNSLLLTKKAEKLLKSEKRSALFEVIFTTFTEKFNWEYNDGYEEGGVGQIGWAYTLYLLLQYGDQMRDMDFYPDQYFKAFPSLFDFFEEDYLTPQEQAYNCYTLRAMSRFARWFGFVITPDEDFELKNPKPIKIIHLQLTELFEFKSLEV